MGLAVKEGGPIDSFQNMIEMSKAEPNSVKVAVNIGLPVHFIPLMVADKAGVEMRMVQVGGGAMDGIARIFQRAFEEHKILPQRMVVVNMEGAGGTIGTRAIKDAARWNDLAFHLGQGIQG